ncbi:MAG: hypothetical protein M9953_13125 [Thermomicrobiales bacterium]|nr:hypothetical protein [Thermomicrobiales bacterium]MCO5226274.1 hypothetical protein [Thermomicrobiales bacterium]MCO5228090.1 hypothetical protein [Thermomicrobiales bacterium]
MLPLNSMLCCDRCGHPKGRGCVCRYLNAEILKMRAPVVYDGWPVNAIRALKYQHERDRADSMARYMVPCLDQLGDSPLLVPVPLHHDRLQERGFNQASLLAGCIARETGLPLEDALIRIKATSAQARSASRAERQEHMVNAFVAAPGWRADPDRDYVIVDDVYTTGATTGACADALALAGATRIAVLTFALDLQPRELESYRRLATAAGIA